LREGKKINGCIFYSSYSLSEFFFKYSCYGFSKKLFNILTSRLENRIEKKVRDLKTSQFIMIYKILLTVVPEKKDFKKKTVFNIFLLDLVNSYRGLRHAFGLPVRGQRTWTNAWSSYRSNLILRQFKIKLSKRLYTSITLNELNIAYLAEQINSLWKLQWDSEWKKAKRQRQVQIKKSHNFLKIDLKAIASANVSQKNKKKQSGYVIGFDPGFTKYVLKQSIKNKNK